MYHHLLGVVADAFHEAAAAAAHCWEGWRVLVVGWARLVGGADDDVLGESVEQRESSGDDAAGGVDALQPRLDSGGVALDLPHELSALFEQRRYPTELAAQHVQEEREPSDEQRDRNNGESDECAHERTFS